MRFRLLLLPLLFLTLAACGGRFGDSAGAHSAGGHSGAEHSQHSDYAGLQSREVKSLSDAEVERYRKGEGGGEALAAELQGFAGPKHVLELARELKLSPRQMRQTRELVARVKREASVYGAALVEEERALDKYFADGGGDESELLNILGTIGKIRALVRYVHLSTHLRQDAILTEEQREMYARLRGYDSQK